MSSAGTKRPSDSTSPTSGPSSNGSKNVWPIFNLVKRQCTSTTKYPTSSPTIKQPTTPKASIKKPENDTPESTHSRRSLSPERSKIPVSVSTPESSAIRRVKSPDSVNRQQFTTPKTVRNNIVNTPSSQMNSPSLARNNETSGDDRQHLHLSYSFLYPPQRFDIKKRSPDHPDYDERTLHVPGHFLDSQTPALRQWWLIKQNNMDAILFFKMGKFYELFNEDAVIGRQNLDIAYMKGDESKPAHAGFPEVSYEKYAKILIDRGYKVLRIEQTETPAMMEERCQVTGKRGKFDKVVKREVCRVTTKGTQMMGVSDSVFYSARNQYLLAVCESSDEFMSEDGLKSRVYGVCFIDVTISKIHLAQFTDDHNQSKLNILLAHHTPTEVLYDRANVSQETYQALTRTGALLTSLKPAKEFWSIKRALTYLKTNQIFQNQSGEFEWPSFLQQLFEEGAESLIALDPKECYSLALNAFGAIVYYLQSQLIADQVLQCASFAFYRTPLERSMKSLSQLDSEDLGQLPPMILDHIALKNLEIFENSCGSSGSTLFESINHCKTHFGERLLRNWLCSPLCDPKQIENRLDAVQALVSNDNVSLMNEFVHVLKGTPDLERLLTKIKSQCYKSESDSRAIMFDDNQYSKAKINSFLTVLQNFKRLQKFIASISRSIQNCNSHVLRRLLTFTTDDGLYPDYSATLDYFETAFDHESAKKTGRIIPAPGVDKTYDATQKKVDDVKEELNDYLEEQKEVIGCRHIEYFGTAKNRYQIQIPEAYCKRVPSDYYIETTRKGFKRYYTPTITKLFQKLTVHEEEMKKCLDRTMSTIFGLFAQKIKLWSAAIECVAILDALQSIASFVRSLKANGVDVCRPTFVSNNGNPLVEYTNGRHPALVKTDPNYIPNDLTLDDRLILLSGANMGGKSTLMRQTALLVVLAQIGSFVPASSMRLTSVDRIFSRLGASDRLLEGESTFYTELVETSAMLRCASRDSLLLLDELGRGTSTYDGTAIAYSVLKEISVNLKCRCLFSTHYHSLVKDFQDDEKVRLAHMACKVEKDHDRIDLDPLKENITFLYKIAEGPVGRSYGFNVARLAGIDDQIIQEAYKKAKEFELGTKVLSAVQTLCRMESDIPKGPDLRSRVLMSLKSVKV